jgi:hypothetical protein
MCEERYMIQCTIKKLKSNGSVVIKGCDGFAVKSDGKEYNLFMDTDTSSDDKTSIGSVLRDADIEFRLKDGLHEWEFLLLRDAVCNNKKVELEISDNVVQSVVIFG